MSTTPTESSRPNGSARRKVHQLNEQGGEKTAEHSASSHAAWNNWDAWCRHLKKRRTPNTYLELLPVGEKKTSPFAWFLPKIGDWIPATELVNTLHKAARKEKAHHIAQLRAMLVEWLAHVTDRELSASSVLEAVAWTSMSPMLVNAPDRHLWLKLMEVVERLAANPSPMSVDVDPLRFNLIAELGWWLALLYPEVPQWQGLATSSREAMSHSLCELTDGEGLLQARHWPLTRPLLACWTRSRALANELHQPLLHTEAETQLIWFLRQSLLLTRPDGSQILDRGDCGKWNRTAFRAALEFMPDRLNTAIAAAILPGGARMLSKSGLRPKTKKTLPQRAANISEWSEGAILRTDWSRDGALCGVTFGSQELHSELVLGDEVFFSGQTTPKLFIDAQQLSAREIRVVCLFDDKDVEYVELELDYGNGWRIQRQMLMATNEQFLFLSDAVLGKTTAEIDYQSSLPLCQAIEFQPAQESREGRLISEYGRAAHILPLAMPEWRNEQFAGELVQFDNELRLLQSAVAPALFCPLFIDLRKKRSRLPLTWRRLTIAEDRIAQPTSVAVGYRVQVGDEQWFFYRSLSGKAVRTVLGQHLIHEFVVGRFRDRGDCDILLQIEPADE